MKTQQLISKLFAITVIITGALMISGTSDKESGFKGVTVRVLETQGGPQIHVNGKPVPPRFFFGNFNTGTIALKSEWTSHSFEFVPGEVKGTGMLQFRFAHQPCEIWLADLHIQDSKTGEDLLPPGSFTSPEGFSKSWKLLPSGSANTVGAVTVSEGVLHVVLKNPQGGNWPDFGLDSNASLRFTADRFYRCSFRARAKPETELRISFYNVTGETRKFVGGPPGSFLSQVALARDAGIDLVSFCWTGYPANADCWSPPEVPVNWAPIDNLFREIIAVNPKVLLLPRIKANAPDWWLQRHPEARMVYDGDKIANISCVSDRTYRADLCAYLEKLSRHLLETFPDNFAGIHPHGQNTGEWFYRNSSSRPLSGYDPATQKAFRQWLKTHGDPQSDTAKPPTPDERRAHPYGLLRDPAREKRLIEFARFQQQEMADHLAAMAAACRLGTDGKKLVVFFYGYAFEFPILPNGAPTSGHYALSSLLKSRDIDILVAPVAYYDRDVIGTGSCMSSAESIEKAGILWLNEDDSRTFLDPDKTARTQVGSLVNLEETRMKMRRNTAQASLRGFGTWWMDLPGQGWFNDARIWEEMSLLHPVDSAILNRREPFTPEIAAIVDEQSMCHLTGGSDIVGRGLIFEAGALLGRTGAPYGQYLLDDALQGHIPAKLQIFLSAWELDTAKRAALIRQRHTGFTRVWCYAPGYLYSDHMDVAGIREITGFEAKAVTLASAKATPTEAGKKLGLTVPWGPRQLSRLGIPDNLTKVTPIAEERDTIRPLFCVTATKDETLATYSDGSTAVAVRHSDKGIDVFVGVPQLTTELIRALARIAGVHMFTEGKANVWAAEGYILLQAHDDGPLVINTGKNGTIVDALNSKVLGKGPKLIIVMKKGEVRVIRY